MKDNTRLAIGGMVFFFVWPVFFMSLSLASYLTDFREVHGYRYRKLHALIDVEGDSGRVAKAAMVDGVLTVNEYKAIENAVDCELLMPWRTVTEARSMFADKVGQKEQP